MEYDVKITGSGTIEKIIESLTAVVDSLKTRKENGMEMFAMWEDETLFTEIEAVDE